MMQVCFEHALSVDELPIIRLAEINNFTFDTLTNKSDLSYVNNIFKTLYSYVIGFMITGNGFSKLIFRNVSLFSNQSGNNNSCFV